MMALLLAHDDIVDSWVACYVAGFFDQEINSGVAQMWTWGLFGDVTSSGCAWVDGIGAGILLASTGGRSSRFTLLR